MVNRLAQESSLYLQQHKDNPVDWWPYSEEAFAEAKKLDRPIFLSIGYSSCFWCHEMSRESFDDKETADFLNSHFVNIKLDREEREDIDRIYQRYYNSYTGENGGWPLSVWMFPDGIPFHIGTYYPKNSGLLGKSFLQICKDIVKSWNSERNSLFETATALSRNIDSSNKILIDTKPFQIGIAQNEVKRLINKMDHVNGGFDSEPKFPRFYTLKFLLDQSLKLNNRSLMNFIIFTFQKMTKGGIYDQLGGGISRYSVDQKWLVPHFEKMLYDNAGLLELSINLFKITKDDYTQYIIQDLISFLFRVMYQGEFGFYSSVNAESEGIEGKYYVWDYSELEKFLGKNFEIAKIRYNLKKRGNFKDPRSKLSNANILSIVGSAQAISEKLNLDITHVYKILNEIKTDLFKRREQRIKPTIDKKLIITWNAMVFKSLIQTSYLLANDNLSNLVINSFNKLLDKSVKENYIARVIYPGSKEETSHISGILDDYAYLIDCLITFFEYTDNWSYIKKAKKLMNLLLSKFYNNEINILYLNEIDNQQNIGQIFHPMDDSFSSSFSITLQCLFKLGKYIEKPELIKIGEKIGQTQYGNVEKYDGAMNEYLFSLEYYLGNYKEFVIVDDDDLDFNKIVMNSPYLTKLIFRYNEKNKKDGRPFWDILEGRTNVKNSTIYICENNTCSLPIMNEEELNLFFKKDLETNS